MRRDETDTLDKMRRRGRKSEYATTRKGSELSGEWVDDDSGKQAGLHRAVIKRAKEVCHDGWLMGGKTAAAGRIPI